MSAYQIQNSMSADDQIAVAQGVAEIGVGQPIAIWDVAARWTRCWVELRLRVRVRLARHSCSAVEIPNPGLLEMVHLGFEHGTGASNVLRLIPL
jgi:hypothetical protein